MENNKKIIVGAVGFVITGILIFYFTSMSATPKNINLPFSGLDFDSPELDVKKFDSSNKKELYDENENFDQNKYDTIAVDLSFLQMKKEKMEAQKKSRYKRKDEASSNKKSSDKKKKLDQEMQMLMDLQNQINNANANANANVQSRPVKEQKVEKQPILNAANYFYGADSANKIAGENLIPAEIVDQGILKAGSTVAIRTKQPIIIKEQNIRIPKGAIMYASANFEATRLILNITSYRRDNTLYPIGINVHDFDGRIGIHLKSKSIFNIPLNVSEDVYDAAVSTYQQQSSLVGSTNEPVPLEQIALLSAGKEVSKEIFETRRVFVPRKYHLWLTINTDNEQ